MYKLTKYGNVVMGNIEFPQADGNSDYEAYKLWLSEGNVPDPVDPPTPAELNAPIYAQLQALDMKLIRPLAERDQARIDAINAEKETLRSQLV